MLLLNIISEDSGSPSLGYSRVYCSLLGYPSSDIRLYSNSKTLPGTPRLSHVYRIPIENPVHIGVQDFNGDSMISTHLAQPNSKSTVMTMISCVRWMMRWMIPTTKYLKHMDIAGYENSILPFFGIFRCVEGYPGCLRYFGISVPLTSQPRAVALVTRLSEQQTILKLKPNPNTSNTPVQVE